MSYMWYLLVVLPAVASQSAGPVAIDDYEYAMDGEEKPNVLEPNVESCERNGRCECHISGEWTRYKEYQALQTTRAELEALEMRLERLDYGNIYQHMENITIRLESLDSRINSQSIDVSTKELIDLKKTVEVLHLLVADMQRNASSAELSIIKAELDKLVAHVQDLWTRNPYGSQDQMKKQLEYLQSQLQGCKNQFGGLGTSYFPGDNEPVTDRLDTEWCKTHEIDSVSDAFTHRYVGAQKGTWFKDPLPRSTTSRSQVFLRVPSYNGIISYKNYTNFITDTGWVRLPTAHVHGLGSVAYNGSFYWPYNNQLYQRNSVNEISQVRTELLVSDDYLQAGNAYTYVDLKPDEFGLWGLWATTDNNNKLTLHELDPVTLAVRRRLPTNKLKSSMCMAFMACGRLYALDMCKVRLPPASGFHRQYVYDTQTRVDAYRPFHVTSKYGHINQLSYNPREKMLMGWDNGHAVTYQIRWRNTKTGEIEVAPGGAPLEPESV